MGEAKWWRRANTCTLRKPVGNDWKSFKAMVEQARAKNLLFQTGYVWRHHDGVNAALDAARKGWLGDILSRFAAAQ
ncbi:MAG: hypothetical protein U5J83_02995 [Bryobacterales bacterium]|nr:hypothetical protein [Bryobacterales bacterium]